MSISYAPSIMIGNALRSRKGSTDTAPPRAVSLANPDFSGLRDDGGPIAHYYLRDISEVGSVGQLPSSEAESHAVVHSLLANQSSNRAHIAQLLGKNATEANLRREVGRLQPTF